MSHYSEIRDEHDRMSDEEKRTKRLADEAKKEFIQHTKTLKELLLRNYIKNNCELNAEYSHSKDYWDSKSKELLELISKLNEKMEK